jgi:deoxyribonuclease V
VRLEPLDVNTIKIVAGIDISMDGPPPRFKRKPGQPLPDSTDWLTAGVVLLNVEEGRVIHRLGCVAPIQFPYVTGFLAFREGPAASRLLAEAMTLADRPDLLIFDGQGIAHPRGLGIASHMGLLADLPSIGAAKTRLTGVTDDLADEGGSIAALWADPSRSRQLGWLARSRTATKPIWLSPGHRIDHASLGALFVRLRGKYRLLDPIRAAHMWVNELRVRAKSDPGLMRGGTVRE